MGVEWFGTVDVSTACGGGVVREGKVWGHDIEEFEACLRDFLALKPQEWYCYEFLTLAEDNRKLLTIFCRVKMLFVNNLITLQKHHKFRLAYILGVNFFSSPFDIINSILVTLGAKSGNFHS